MKIQTFKRILREEATRVLSESAAGVIFSATAGRLYINGRKTKLTIDAVGLDPMDDVTVNKAATNSDGSISLSLQHGERKKDVTLKDQEIIRDIVKTISAGKPYSYSRLGNEFTLTPIA